MTEARRAKTQDERREEAIRSQIGGMVRNNVRDLRNRAMEEEWLRRAQARLGDSVLAMPHSLTKSQQDEWALKIVTAEVDRELGLGTFKPSEDPWIPLPTSVRDDCARATGLSPSAWQALESNARDITAAELVSVAAAMHVDVAYILSPTIEALNVNDDVRCGDFAGAHVAPAQTVFLWLRGLVPLPGQDAETFARRMGVPTVHTPRGVLDEHGESNPRSRRRPDSVEIRKRNYWRTELGYALEDGPDAPNAAAEGLRLLSRVRAALRKEPSQLSETDWRALRTSIERLRQLLPAHRSRPKS